VAAFTLIRRVEAPIERVFAVFTDWERAASRIEAIEKVEILTPGPVRRGTRLRETRSVLGKRVTEELEVVRFEPGEGYTLTCQTHGCTFTTGCLMVKDGAGTKVEVALDCVPHTLPAKLKVKLALPAIRREFEKDLEQLAAAAESPSPRGP
jgi:hypothetical protein